MREAASARFWWLGTAVLLLLGGSASAGPAPPTSGAPLECVSTRTESRYRGYGYDHLVHLENGCKQKASCTVTTSANPEKQQVTLRSKEKKTVVTFRGSPAREFDATVACSAAG